MAKQKQEKPAEFAVLPNHIGIIMDGNGRWAKLRGLPRYAGHRIGAKTFKTITRYCNQVGVRFLTVYAFSTENWRRPQEEVDAILKLLDEYLDDAENFKKENVRTRFIGDLSALGEQFNEKIRHVEDMSRDFTGLTLNIAFNYGGRDEIVRGVRRLAEQCRKGELAPDQITEESIAAQLDTAGQPDVDLIIRPSGELRLSNFMLWQSAYAEYIFMDILWPDFAQRDLDRALAEFARRSRRFGGI